MPAARRIGVGAEWAWGEAAVKRVASAAERRRRPVLRIVRAGLQLLAEGALSFMKNFKT